MYRVLATCLLLLFSCASAHASTTAQIAYIDTAYYVHTEHSSAYGNDFARNFLDPYIYHLTDGTTWQSGAGSFPSVDFRVQSLTLNGNNLVYDFGFSAGDVALTATDFGFGSNQANYSLSFVGPVFMTAAVGSTTGLISGNLLLTFDSPVNYWWVTAPFSPFDVNVGDVIPFNSQVGLLNDTFTSHLLTDDFEYTFSGTIGSPIPEPNISLVLPVFLLSALLIQFVKRRFAYPKR